MSTQGSTSLSSKVRVSVQWIRTCDSLLGWSEMGWIKSHQLGKRKSTNFVNFTGKISKESHRGSCTTWPLWKPLFNHRGGNKLFPWFLTKITTVKRNWRRGTKSLDSGLGFCLSVPSHIGHHLYTVTPMLDDQMENKMSKTMNPWMNE